jgi:hypothetical protein
MESRLFWSLEPRWKDGLRFMERRDRIGLIPRSISLILADAEHP